MKKLLSALLLLPALAFGAVQNDIIIGRVQANGFSTSNDYISTAKTGEMQFIMFDGSGLINTVRKVGPSITCGPSQCDAVASAVNWSSIVGAPSFSTVANTGNYSDLLNKPTTLAGAGITDATSATQLTTALAGYATTGALASKQNALVLTTTGTGAATLVGSTLNVPTPATATPFNFSQPVARTLLASTSYQATDTSKAAVIVPSFSCQNATTVLAASGCTLQVRVGTGTLTCSTGTVYYTQSLTVGLGLLITQNSTNPVQINLPIGASFIICPTVGTFTVSAVEQTAG